MEIEFSWKLESAGERPSWGQGESWLHQMGACHHWRPSQLVGLEEALFALLPVQMSVQQGVVVSIEEPVPKADGFEPGLEI